MKSLSLAKPHLLVIAGIPGSGKSYFADKFASTFSAPVVSFDRLHEITAQGWSSGDNKLVENLAYEQLEQLFTTQASIIIDGGSDARTDRQELAKNAKSHGYETLIVWVQTDLPTAKHRTVNGAKRHGGMLRFATLEEYNKALGRFTAPNATEKSVVISGKHTYATQAKTVLKKLTETRGDNHVILRSNERPLKPSHSILIR